MRLNEMQVNRFHRTMEFCDIHAELISLFQYSSAPVLDESIKSCSELVHATAQIVESEVDAGQLVGHGRRIVRGGAHRGAHGGLESRHDCGMIKTSLAEYTNMWWGAMRRWVVRADEMVAP